MRIPRQRVFKIVINGLQEWVEDAGNRVAIEVQHKLVTTMFPGKSVKVIEQYLGGAKPKLTQIEDEEEGVN